LKPASGLQLEEGIKAFFHLAEPFVGLPDEPHQAIAQSGEHFVDRELKATLGNKRVDREHHQSTRRGEGERRGAILGSAAILD
jgi:hypothetical protein